LLVLSMSAPAAAVDRTTIDEPFSERALSNTFPGADSFSEPSGEYRTVEAYEEVDGERELVGYVYLTSNVVDVEGYGNEPIEYLVALDTNGTIRGVELVEQHQPFFDRISAIQRLRQFGYQMVGMSVTEFRGESPAVHGGDESNKCYPIESYTIPGIVPSCRPIA